jgi:nitroreductase
MYIWAAIKNRRSIRNFTADPLEELEKIQEKIEQGKYKVMENESQFSLFLN